jgi:tetratricopeptide (TPR) repeat protein
MRPRLRSLAFLVAMSAGSVTVRAQESSPDEDRPAVARTLFSQGRVAYDLGSYDEAITKFRSAYEQVQEPAFLFNIAQAYRLKGDCSRAVDAYRHFLRLSNDSENREAAESHLAELKKECPRTDRAITTTKAAEVSPPPVDTRMPILSEGVRAPAPPQAKNEIVYATWATAGTLAAAALGISAWNVGRYNDWSKENDQLANPPPGSDPSGLVDRQAANDDQLSSIHKAERLSWALAAGAAVFLATGLVLKMVVHRR